MPLIRFKMRTNSVIYHQDLAVREGVIFMAGKNEKKNISTYIKCIDDNELYSVQEGR